MTSRPRRGASESPMQALLSAVPPSSRETQSQSRASTSTNSLGPAAIAPGNAEGGAALVERILRTLSREQRELALHAMNNITFPATSSSAVGTPQSNTPLTNGGYDEGSPFLPQTYSARPLPANSIASTSATTMNETINYVPLPTRSGRIPHLPDTATKGIETRDSQLFNDYFDFPSDDEEEDPDFLPVVDGVQRDWDDILIPGSYGSSEGEGEEGGRDEGDEAESDEGGYYNEFLAGLGVVNGGPTPGGMIPPYDLRRTGNTFNPASTSLPTPPLIPTPSPIPLPASLPANRSPPTTRARRPLPIPKEGALRNPTSWTPLLPAASTSTAIVPPKPAPVAKVKAPPVKRIKLTPEESKARTAARSAAAGQVRSQKRRAAKAEYATRCVTLEAENQKLKERVEFLENELVSGNRVSGRASGYGGARGGWSSSEIDQDRFSVLEGDITTGESIDGNPAVSPTIPNPFRTQPSPNINTFSPHLSTSTNTGERGKEEIVMTNEERQNVALLLQWASSSRLASSFGLGLGLQQ